MIEKLLKPTHVVVSYILMAQDTLKLHRESASHHRCDGKSVPLSRHDEKEPRKPREERLCRVFACIRTDGGVCV